MNTSDEFEFELPARGDDRPGIEDLEEDVVVEDIEEDDDDYPEDATEDDIDLVIALYREDGEPVAMALELDLANDLDGLITQLRRLPGDAGAVGLVSVGDEVFVIVRVRGKHVQVFCSDAGAAFEWPIARDVVDFLDAELPDENEDGYPIGDSDVMADVGMPAFELEAMAEDYDEDSTTLLELVVKKAGFAAVYAKALASFE
ncbi:MAG: tRNA adenosine deaminase-associated protein [Propionicimonas sp.]|uniref:tRNA adenosine deaminase-associated protein n=1 Tax=Propionicimonas sp. TaxID=1955623 RepID=UPI001DD1DD55|nr:tRNA adenosine deaminase-associated protein [Propionicimonas sp.]MBU4188642.1 tRNA adenosine deaminase-associated protein [Actinomycetota bacterium]MBU4206280.1 tRNA adenosine deaminase-associated protein [Actinomycetota bacterium]MBU4251259.1 tRNA adenosine deaminase-associated protein [Actinomycetota bacterium]MBU4363312.1 tRNA adenosine deaminase-associated protein [Actinomycetota bacterium]MBU4411293.1 tRNA adenosine deaminase-associated protein [Actinomycetota bacterium]